MSVISASSTITDKKQSGNVKQDRYAIVGLSSSDDDDIETIASSKLSLLRQTSTFAESVTTQDNNKRQVSSNILGFVTFLKALFGMSLLSSPKVLDQTGPMLGTLTYAVIISACTFACYLLLEARSTVLHSGGKKGGSVVSYGILGRKLLGKKYSPYVTFLIVTLHMLFGAHMVSASGNMLAEAWNTYYYQEAENANDHQQEFDESNMQSSSVYQWKLMILMFPLVTMLLQFRNMKDLFIICSSGLIIYLLGCVGTLVFTTVVEYIYGSEFNNSTSFMELYNAQEDLDDDYYAFDDNYTLYDNNTFGDYTTSSASFADLTGRSWYTIEDFPDDMWEWKFIGIPEFVASTVCAVEGINLALPTANTLSNPQESAFPVVSAVVVCYGLLTMIVAWVGYLGGLGGGEGTPHGKNSCLFVDECLPTEFLSQIYQIALGIALLFTLPIILYPSLEMLQVWADEQWYKKKEKIKRSLSSDDDNIATSKTSLRYQWKTLATALIVPRNGSVSNLLDYYSEHILGENSNSNNYQYSAYTASSNNNNNTDKSLASQNQDSPLKNTGNTTSEIQKNIHKNNNNDDDEESPRYFMLEDENENKNRNNEEKLMKGSYLPTASFNRILHSSAHTVNNEIDYSIEPFPTAMMTNEENLLDTKKYMDDEFQSAYRKKKKKLKYATTATQQQQHVSERSAESSIQKSHNLQLLFRFQLHRHWRLRVFHAFFVCILGALEKDFEASFTFFKGIGLSIAGFILPCILYYYANIRTMKKFSSLKNRMKVAILGLLTLGLTNVMLVCISSFTDIRLLPIGFHEHIAQEEETKFIYWQ